MKFNLTYQQLKSSEKSVYSQAGQDGVLDAIFNQLEIDKGYFIDIGSRDGIELSNTINLRLHGWKGIFMDVEPLADIVLGVQITAENINEVIFSAIGDTEIDLLSLDIDGNEFYVLKALSILPKVICVEYNSKFRNDESYAIEYNPDHKWEGDDYYGASLLALKKLGEQKGYTLVYIVAELDAIFIRNNLLSSDYVPTPIEALFPEPIIAHTTVSNKKWVAI